MHTQQTDETVQEQDLETTGDDVTRLVPVAESIRYRRRAQSAERKTQDLADQLAQANQRIAQMSDDLAALELDRNLSRKLTSAGAVDLEAAALIAKARLADDADGDMDACIEQLRKEKGYLFTASERSVTLRKTAGAKERISPRQTLLERAARRATKTQRRGDLQEYLRLRRSGL
jgi:TolA-binding protein